MPRHLPMQNREKMCASRSSGARRPLISSSAARASCRSASTNSSGIDPPSAAAASRARDQRAVRALDERDVPHVGHRRPIAQRLDVQRGDDRAAASRRALRRSPPTPRTARSSLPRRRQVALICNAKNFAMPGHPRRSRCRGCDIDPRRPAAPGPRPSMACRARATPSRSIGSSVVAQTRRCRPASRAARRCRSPR